jgi:glycine/D-amino acid oxidase-like deaminating enzyme
VIQPVLTRRRFLQGAVAASGAVAFRALASPRDNLRNGEILPSPDFTLLRESEPHVIGVRPHRRGGVRLELEAAPLRAPTGNKHLIHNYGHGGAGITLSWGCASVVTELLAPLIATLRQANEPPRVAILGSGVVGLTSATEIHRKWPALPITVYAKDLDLRATTSFIAGGQFEPSGIFHEYEGSEQRKQLFFDYLRRSRDRIVEIQRSPQRLLFGVAERKDYTLDHENRALDVFTPSDVIPPFRRGRLPFDKLDIVGREYTTWLMNPMILLPKLKGDLEAAGVPFQQRHFEGDKDLAALPENILVNCTGYGAKKLMDDPQVVPQRGHLVVLQKTQDRQFYFFSGGCENPSVAYVFCRQNDIVVGGSVQPGNDSMAHSPADAPVFNKILSNARDVFSGRPAACRA